MFHDVRLPPHIERGAEGGPSFKTSIITLTSGIEQRNMEWSRSRGEWDISYSIQTKEDYSEIIKFFYARRGKAFGFRFKDWSDYSVAGQRLGVGTLITQTNGSTTPNRLFPLFKSYSDVGGEYIRQITRPIASTVEAFIDGNRASAVSVLPGGILSFNGSAGSAHVPQEGQVVTANFEFDVPVRFDIDKLEVEVEWEDAANISSIDIVELKENR